MTANIGFASDQRQDFPGVEEKEEEEDIGGV